MLTGGTDGAFCFCLLAKLFCVESQTGAATALLMRCCHSKWLQLSVSRKMTGFSLFHMLADYACERVSAGPSGKPRVSQLCSTGCSGSLGCCLAPLLTGEVKEIKWNLLNLVLPNVLWHPHSAETVGVPTQRNSDKTNSASLKRILRHKTCVHHLHWCGLTRGGFLQCKLQ